MSSGPIAVITLKGFGIASHGRTLDIRKQVLTALARDLQDESGLDAYINDPNIEVTYNGLQLNLNK